MPYIDQSGLYALESVINDLISNAQKISRFGELEIIREEASLLVAKLRNDIAFAEMQYSLGSLYSSVGMNFVPKNALEMNEKDLAKAIESNLNRWTKKYTALVVEPINEQKPTLKQLKANDNLVAYSSLSGGGFIFMFITIFITIIPVSYTHLTLPTKA